MQAHARTILAVGLLVACLWGASPGSGQSTLAPEEVAAIQRAAQASRDLAARDMALANSLGNPALVETSARKAKQRADAAMTSAVIALMSQNMGQADAIVAAAVAAAPESRESILAAVRGAFPHRRGGAAVPTGPPAARVAALPVTPVPAPAPVGRAGPPPPEEARAPVQEPVFDPLEPVNRGIFAVNDVLDTLVFRPIATVYGSLMPDLGKEAVSHFFENLKSPVILVNDLLQFTFEDAAVTTGRFVINSSVGLLGFFEVAEDFGLEPHTADFGQTLHSYGVGQGFYVMVPVLGPNTVRDGLVGVVDTFFQPANYVLSTNHQLVLSGSEGMVVRESLLDTLDDFKANSIDYYAAVRGAFYQDRAKELRKGREAPAETIDALFEGLE